MSLKDCVNRAVDGGEMDPKRAEQVLREYDETFEGLRQNMGHTAAEAAAARIVVDRVKREAFRRRRLEQLRAAATARLSDRMANYTNAAGKSDPGAFLRDIISNRHGSGGQTVEGLYKATRSKYRGMITESAKTFRANVLGQRRNQKVMADVVREIFGEDTGNAAAKRMAQDWAKTSEDMRTRFNSAGGDIGKRSDWGLPQVHDGRKVRKAGYEVWRDAILPRLDLEKMGREYNDGVPFTPETIELRLKDAYEAVRTDGHSRRSPSGMGQGKSRAKKGQDQRFFAFKSADDWMEYSREFGSGQDVLNTMNAHVDEMSMDIALLEMLGPNPDYTFAYLKDAAASMAALSDDVNAPVRVQRAAKTAQNMYDLLLGRTNIPHNQTFAKVSSAIREYGTSALLGRAVISSITDANTMRIQAGFAGMGQAEPMKMMMRIMKSPKLQEELAEARLIFENGVDIGNAVARYELEEMQFNATARLADFTIRSTGLGYLTEARRQAFGASVMHTIASDWRGKGFNDLNPRAQRTLQSYGLSRDDWELIRSAEVYTTEGGLTLTRPQEVEAVAGQAVADRYMEAIQSMQDFAVIQTDLYGRAMALGNTERGTVVGEFVRFGLQFKGFPITLMMMHVGRMIREASAGRPGQALSYAAGLVIWNTVLGAAAIQMKELSKGRDPREMNTTDFLGAAFLQGGGVGIFGDFLFADQNRFGGGLGQTLAGPGVGLVQDTLKLTVGNIQDGGKNAGADIVNYLRRWTPGGSNWYWSAAYEREVLDQIQQIVDPGAARSFRSKERSARNYDTGFFYGPGNSVVSGDGIRAPDFGNAIGN